MTLIEVLISMFVLLVGLLGVGTICQLGRLTLVETAKFDRAAACGRAALREVRIRRMLDVTNWRDVNGNQITAAPPSNTTNFNGTPALSATFDPMASYCIDPVMIGQTAASAPGSLQYLDRFPADAPPTAASTVPHYIRSLKRVTLGVTPLGPTLSTSIAPTLVAHPAVASRLFSWRDDLAFDSTNVPKLRPQRLYRNINGIAQTGFESGVVAPYLLGPRTTPVLAETDLSAQGGGGAGGYSWMVTVTPAYQEMPLQSGANAGALAWTDHHLFNVSVVVFYKRNLSLPFCSNGQVQNLALGYDQSECSERVVNVSFLSPPAKNTTPSVSGASPVANPTGYGGGDVVLTAPTIASAPGDLLNVKRDDWIMVCCDATVYNSANSSGGNNSTNLFQPVVYFKWYRVVAVDDSATSIANYPTSRRVTLAGPDWPAPSQYYPNGILNSDGYTVRAVLMSGIVGVYSDVVALESNRLWAPAP